MGITSFFQNLFKINPSKGYINEGTQAKLLSGSPSEYSVYSGELYANNLVRSIVHKIASYGSMIKFQHIRGEGKDFTPVHDNIDRLLTVKPCKNFFITPAELQYRTWTDLFLRNNSYQWIQRDQSGEPIAILPIVAKHVEMKEINGFLFYKFYFDSGDKVILPAADVVHNKRFQYRNDIFGEDNEPLRDPVGLVQTMDVSLDASLKNGAQIKGILKHQNTIDPDDLAKHEKLFKESYLKAQNSGGIGMLDAKFDFIPIQYSGKITDAEQMKEIRDYVYRYFNINDRILMSDYTSAQWQSYHEGVIAPILNGMEQNYNIHFFTEKELGYGNRIQSSVNMISFLDATQKINMVKLALDGALYTRNEIRQWFGDAPIEGGDTLQFSKNFTENTQTNGQGGSTGGESNQTSQTNPANAVQE